MINNEKEIIKKLTRGIVVFIVLCICFCITTFALVYAIVSVEDNIFQSGSVAINLNDGNAVIEDPNLYFEPGMSVKKTFFVRNESTRPIYYKLYLNAVSGDLAQVLKITIIDKTDPVEKVLYEGVADSLRRFNVKPVEKQLEAGEERNLEIIFHLEENVDYNFEECNMEFNLCADAVQAEHNPNYEFGTEELTVDTSSDTGTDTTTEAVSDTGVETN